MHDSRAGDRTPVHYTLKTNAPITSHSHSLSLSSRAGMNGGKSTTPISSPRAPCSVGQNHPPKLSPHRPEMRPSSPNYFNLVVNSDSAHDPRESSGLGNNWSPASSSIKSFTATLPKPVTLESNPDIGFEEFRRQVDLNRGASFALSTSHYIQPNPAPKRPQVLRWHTHASDTGSESSFPRALSSARDHPPSRMDVDQVSLQDSAYMSSESKRNSEASLPTMQFPGSIPRFESPLPMDPAQSQTTLTRAEERDPRLSVTEHRPEPPSPQIKDIRRSATLPTKLEPGQPSMISAAALKEIIEKEDDDSVLLLDIRSFANYATSRIRGALNLCLPSTLLKRAMYNTEKLQQMFGSNNEAVEKFSTWRDASWIIVYDARASDNRDTDGARHMIQKFTNEGFLGETGILRGGFQGLLSTNPDMIDNSSGDPSKSSGGPGLIGGGLAPVIGGVMLPTTKNPFFSNIRQNMDLADGVGQRDVSWPQGLEPEELPQWLREAADQPDHGKKVSDRFLRIEQDEKTRMQNAYAAFNENNVSHNPAVNGRVQLCGVEKGGKNRYKDILPFEHARVKLQNKPEGSCDYINASHLTASRSNKRYIASQGPLPATFEDFWSVVWEQDVRVIIMLTAESEGGQMKCHPYWNDREYGPMQLKKLSEKKASLDLDKHKSNAATTQSTMPSGEASRKRANTTTTLEAPATNPAPAQPETFVTIRKFALSHAGQAFAPIREITHLHFSSWPDFGAPAQPSHLLALVELANVMQRAALPVETASIIKSSKIAHGLAPITWYDEPEADGASRPMLVHCSAGCGRTGAFCTVDSVIDMMKRQRLSKMPGGQPQVQPSAADMQMDLDDAISPMTNRQMSFKFDVDHQPTLDRQMSFTFDLDHQPSFEETEAQLDLSWMQDDSLDLIQKTVEDFREQRISMVQSLQQYVLCYETVLEWVNRLHEKGRPGPDGRRHRSESYQFA
ncbi:hypothetical protein HDV64DRAFT_268080 [Trichoderma sp. TUCIM 5745]